MALKKWTPRFLLPRAEIIAYLLSEHPNITAVCLTGSVARWEKKAHDIDLVVLFNGDAFAGIDLMRYPVHTDKEAAAWMNFTNAHYIKTGSGRSAARSYFCS